MSSLTVHNMKIRSLDLDYYELSWAVSNTLEDILDYEFEVQRSEAPAGPFTSISTPFQDRYLFVDNRRPVGHRYRNYFYRILVRNRGTKEETFSEAVNREPEADLIALEVRSHMQLLFREFIGRRCWVIPVRTFGQRCPSCWNPTLQKRNKSGCITCYDTGFAKGYLSPIETWVSIDPSANTEQNSSTGPTQQNNTTARFAYTPQVKPRDLLVEPENRRWRITKVSTTEQVRAPLHQEVEIHEIPDKDVEFSIPLLLDNALRDLWLSPSRNFSNPHNLESAMNEDLDAAFSLYSRRPGQ
jgi:hypothetical protein